MIIPVEEAEAWRRRMLDETSAVDWRRKEIADELRAVALQILAKGQAPEPHPELPYRQTDEFRAILKASQQRRRAREAAAKRPEAQVAAAEAERALG